MGNSPVENLVMQLYYFAAKWPVGQTVFGAKGATPKIPHPKSRNINWFIMKKIMIAITMLVATTTTLFVACKKENMRDSKSQTETPTPAKKMGGQVYPDLASFIVSVDSVGMLHNECMDYLYDSLLTVQNSQWIQDSVQVNNFIKAVTIDFFEQKGIDCSSFAGMNMSTLGTIPSNLSNNASTILNAVINAVDAYGNGQISHVQLMGICVQQKELSFQLTDNDERYAIGSSCAVAQYSMTYWKDNANKYDDLINGPNPPVVFAMSDNQRRVGKADLKGAILGPVVAAAASFAVAIKIVAGH